MTLMQTLIHDRRTHAKRLAAGLLALAFSLVAPGSGFAQITEQNVAEKIAAAKTPADHQAIAAFYRSEAAEAAAKVKTHEAMMSSYRTAGKPGEGLAAHCRTLIAQYTAAEKDYTHMAEEHEALAKEGSK